MVLYNILFLYLVIIVNVLFSWVFKCLLLEFRCNGLLCNLWIFCLVVIIIMFCLFMWWINFGLSCWFFCFKRWFWLLIIVNIILYGLFWVSVISCDVVILLVFCFFWWIMLIFNKVFLSFRYFIIVFIVEFDFIIK